VRERRRRTSVDEERAPCDSGGVGAPADDGAGDDGCGPAAWPNSNVSPAGHHHHTTIATAKLVGLQKSNERAKAFELRLHRGAAGAAYGAR
jgi:hypothetical protein